MPGHWSSHQRSPQIHRCNNAAACPGGNSSTCAHGYTSNLCGSCAPGWGTSKPFTCRKCWSKAATITLYVLAGLAMLGLAKLLCHVTMSRPIGQALGQQQQQQQQQPAGASGSNLSGQLPVAPTPTDLIKPFVVYLQFLWVVAALQGIDEPDTLAVPLQAVMWLFSSSTPQSMSLECVLRSGGAVLLPVQVFALSISMPLLLMGVLLVLETVRACWAGRRSAWGRAAAFRAEKHRLVAQAIVLMFLFYPMLMRSVLSLFACIPLDAPVQAPYHAAAVGSFWVGHMSQLCWQGYHRVLVLACGVPLLILLGVLLPATKLTVLIINRKSLYTHAGFLQFSFLYSMYRPRMFFWEVVVLYQATLLVAISVFSFSMGAYYACLALTAALAFSMALHAWLHPYASSVAGNTAMRGIACVCFTSFAALSFLPPAGSPGQASGVNQRYAMVAGAVVLAVNVAYIVSVAVQLARTVNWRALRSIAARWGHKLCGCGKPTPAVGGQAAADKSPQQESVC